MCLKRTLLVAKLKPICGYFCLYLSHLVWIFIHFWRYINLFNCGVLTQSLLVVTHSTKYLHHPAFLTFENLWFETCSVPRVLDKNHTNNEENRSSCEETWRNQKGNKIGVWINGTFFSLVDFKLRMVILPRTKAVLRHIR